MHKTRSGKAGVDENDRAAALTKAAMEAARQLGLSPAETAATLGVPQGALEAMRKGSRAVDGMNGEADRADALVRMTKRLHALLGEADTVCRSWLRRDNESLDGRPVELIQQRDGVLKVASYLERERSLSAAGR